MEVWGIHHQGIYNILTVIKYSGLRSNDQLIRVLLEGMLDPCFLEVFSDAFTFAAALAAFVASFVSCVANFVANVAN